MLLVIDLESQTLVQVAGSRSALQTVNFKRGDSARIEVQFVVGTTVQELSGTTITGSFGLKEVGKYDTATCIVGPASWTKEGTGTSTKYVFTPSFNTAALNTLLAHGDADDTNDEVNVTLMGEISWTIDGAVYSTQQFSAVVANDILKGSEGPAIDVPAEQLSWLAANGIVYDPAITGLTGGTATDLDGIVTVGVTVGRVQLVSLSQVLYLYELKAATTAESDPDIIRPDDYNASTNAKVWALVEHQCYSLYAVAGIGIGSGSNLATISGSLLTGPRSHNVPNAAGTYALTSQADGSITQADLNIDAYADDTAAASGGVAVGDIYRKTDGTVVWRQS